MNNTHLWRDLDSLKKDFEYVVDALVLEIEELEETKAKLDDEIDSLKDEIETLKSQLNNE